MLYKVIHDGTQSPQQYIYEQVGLGLTIVKKE